MNGPSAVRAVGTSPRPYDYTSLDFKQRALFASPFRVQEVSAS